MAAQKDFIVSGYQGKIGGYSVLAGQVARLGKHGRVHVNVSGVSGKDFDEVPAGGSPWHEYASYGVGLHKVYPHKKLVPFVNGEFVAKNRRLLRSRLRVLRRHKLGACFSVHEPHFLPEAFFRAYPHLRGARVDHPRRGCEEAFAMCFDHAEGKQILSEMVADLVKDVPELGMICVQTNDAGAGFCWTQWLYPGPNGPDHCRGMSVGQRIVNFVDAIRSGAGKPKLDVQIGGNFVELENECVNGCVDEHVFWGRRPKRAIHVGSMSNNPIMGMVSPLGTLRALGRWRDPELRKVFVHLGGSLRHNHELPETVDLVIDVIDAFCRKPAYGLLGRLKLLRELCAKWVGQKQADELLEAFDELERALALKRAAFPIFTCNYVGVSMRIINRPLVVMPDRLTAEEEAYFLPHVFNIHTNEARMDYLDWHGGKLRAGGMADTGENPRIVQVKRFRGMLERVAETLAGIRGRGRAAAALRQMAMSLRMYGCIARSMHNFYCTQVVRDRNQEKLMGEPTLPSKQRHLMGDPDLLLLYDFMRDELDNTAQLIDILENGGLRMMNLAPTRKLEDTFLLGPDLVDQLKQKIDIMRRHWLDAQAYMATPHK